MSDTTTTPAPARARRLPDFFYNWLSAAGALIALVVFTLIVVLALIDLFAYHGNPYLSLLTYLMLPGVLVAGLALVALGALVERYRLSHGKSSLFPTEFHVDLRNARHRNAVVGLVVVGTVFAIATAIGSFKAFEATESVAFCGTLCHEVMEPEHVAYQNSAHARVACVACHIGPGAEWFVKAKLGGLYQIYATALDKYPRPIPTPIANLRPARDTCLTCHWPDKFFGSRDVTRPHFLSDEMNTPYPIRLSIKVGGGTKPGHFADGVHWHVHAANKVEYIARDYARLDIPWVRMTDAGGKVTEFVDTKNPLTAENRATLEVRAMDCMDCHNRPSHNYRPPMHTVNEAIDDGSIDRALPYVKREAMRALDQEYPDLATALGSIEARLVSFYEKEYPDLFKTKRPALDTAVKELQRIYRQNFFPAMKVTWRKYPSHLGHSLDPGCFRCHGREELKSADGRTITGKCDACHEILAQGLPEGTAEVAVAPGGLAFRHPVDIGGAEATGHCTECHQGGAELY